MNDLRSAFAAVVQAAKEEDARTSAVIRQFEVLSETIPDPIRSTIDSGTILQRTPNGQFTIMGSAPYDALMYLGDINLMHVWVEELSRSNGRLFVPKRVGAFDWIRCVTTQAGAEAWANGRKRGGRAAIFTVPHIANMVEMTPPVPVYHFVPRKILTNAEQYRAAYDVFDRHFSEVMFFVSDGDSLPPGAVADQVWDIRAKDVLKGWRPAQGVSVI